MRSYGILSFSGLTYFTQHNTPRVHPCPCKWQGCLLFFWLSDIPLHLYTFSLSTPPLMDTRAASVFLPVGNKFAINMSPGLFNSVWWFSSDEEVDFWDHVVFPFLILLSNLHPVFYGGGTSLHASHNSVAITVTAFTCLQRHSSGRSRRTERKDFLLGRYPSTLAESLHDFPFKF